MRPATASIAVRCGFEACGTRFTQVSYDEHLIYTHKGMCREPP